MEDAEARFRAVFESTYPTLARYARHRGLSASDADDLVAGAYEVAWRRFDVVPTGDGALPWLVAVERNLLRNRRRKLFRERAVMERLSPPQEGEFELSTVTWQDIRRALERLSDEDRELILLIAWDDLSPAQAASVLGLSPGAARTRLHRARGRIARLLDVAPDVKRPAGSGQKRSETPPTVGLSDE